jgi:hypothetical protein
LRDSFARCLELITAGAGRKDPGRRRVASAVTAVVCATIYVEQEHPYKAIIDTAESRSCDLIVTASHIDAALWRS